MMPRTKPALNSLKLPVRIAEGIRGKLDFDFACGRGHSFGEYHVHGVVNEILCSSLDPIQHRVQSGCPHPALQTPGATGRRREVDFAVEMLVSGTRAFYAEVKWAGSSHCKQENVLSDLCRLQIIKDAEPGTECVFVLAGHADEIDHLFSTGILVQGTSCLLHKNGSHAALGEGALTAFVAQLLRALMDLVALRKESWSGIEWLIRGMRIDEAELASLGRKEFTKLKSVYKQKAVNAFLAALEAALTMDRKTSTHD